MNLVAGKIWYGPGSTEQVKFYASKEAFVYDALMSISHKNIGSWYFEIAPAQINNDGVLVPGPWEDARRYVKHAVKATRSLAKSIVDATCNPVEVK